MTTTTRTIQILAFSTMPQLALDGWDPNAGDADDYATPRAAALYEALGVSTKDDDYALAANSDGRWALIGLTASGHRYAAEVDTATAKARAAYADVCREIGTTIEDETNTILSIGRDLLPPCAVVVLDGGEPTARYWQFCQEQTEKAQREHDAETSAGHEWHQDEQLTPADTAEIERKALAAAVDLS